MSDTVQDWLDVVEDRYPSAHAADWDAVGLQVGDPAWEIARVLVTLDVTSQVIDEAAEVPGTLVLAHHPLLFRPLPSLTPSSASGRIALAAATSRVAVVAAHTNLDVARDGAGTSDPVADVLDLQDVQPLTSERIDARHAKLVVFVPPEALDAVVEAISAAGGGRIGAYERCTFRSRGVGTFRPGPDADPYSGTVGQDAAEDEYRVETVVPLARAGTVVRALRQAHPYEEPAYDLLRLFDHADVGFGCVGTLPSPAPLVDVADLVRARLPAPHLRYAGDPGRQVQRVAVVGGAGDSLIGTAIGAGVDVYVTGDLRHHVTLDALEQGLSLIDAGHHATEVAALPAWIRRLADAARVRGLQAPVVASRTPTVPWR